MIYGVGVDILEVDRFKSLINDKKFLERIFTEKELQLIKGNYITAADNFASKEAVVKSIKTGFRGINPRDIEVLRDINGAPVVNLYGEALEFFSGLNLKIHLSISNTNVLSIAYAICEEIKI